MLNISYHQAMPKLGMGNTFRGFFFMMVSDGVDEDGACLPSSNLSTHDLKTPRLTTNRRRPISLVVRKSIVWVIILFESAKKFCLLPTS